MLEPLVVARRVFREFPEARLGRRVILNSIDCLVFSGDRIAITGPSGSGKSTLLNVIGGLDRPTRGDVFWPGLTGADASPGSWRQDEAAPERAGKSPGNERPPADQVGMVFQSPSLLPALTVMQNVQLPLMLRGAAADTRERARETLDMFDLGPLAEKFPEELSGGQAQRVAIARALVTRPLLVLADEPTGQLDHPTAQSVVEILLNLIADSDTGLIVATHDETIAARMNTQWQLDHGRLVTETEKQPCG